MSQIKVSEIFGPRGYWDYPTSSTEEQTTSPSFIERFGVTQGEGKYVGTRSTFLRTFGCNFTCPSFGLPKDTSTTEPDEIGETVHLYKSINELPAAKFGCDSYFSWHPKFKQFSPMLSVGDIAEQILVASGGSFFHQPHSPVHLVITGGEPLLGWQRAYCDLLLELRNRDHGWKAQPYQKLPVTFETNGTQKLLPSKGSKTVKAMDVFAAHGADITWSISPKLSGSGHTNAEAIIPSVVASYLEVVHSGAYFKFVVATPDELDEVDHVVRQYKAGGVQLPVYIMPEGGTQEEFAKHTTLELVAESVKRGYNITPRLHVMIGGNAMAW